MYPNSLTIFGHDIDVKVFSDPIEVVGGDVVMAQYDPQTTTISLMHNPDKPAVGGSNFIHEVIEAADCHGDLQLTHTQISTLASALYQAFTSGGVNFGRETEPRVVPSGQRVSMSCVLQ